MNCESKQLKEVLSYIVDNRGKTPPCCAQGQFELIEINAIATKSKFPQYNAIRKYVDEETYMNWFRKGHPKIGDILIPTVGTLDALAIMKENRGCIAQNIIAIRTRENVCNPKFLYYSLSNPALRKELLNLDIGGVQPRIKVPHLLSIEISIPPLPEQRAIAATLSCLDDKIELNNRMNKTLEEMAQAIFKSWFVDFEPFQDGEFVDSELGRIPKGWRVGVLDECIELYDYAGAQPDAGHRPCEPRV